jgi:hypothetical protein
MDRTTGETQSCSEKIPNIICWQPKPRHLYWPGYRRMRWTEHSQKPLEHFIFNDSLSLSLTQQRYLQFQVEEAAFRKSINKSYTLLCSFTNGRHLITNAFFQANVSQKCYVVLDIAECGGKKGLILIPASLNKTPLRYA